MKVLIVDDNKNNRMIVSLLLEDYMDERDDINFEIDEAADGLEAVAQCKRVKYDLVLMDIMMPNMDGIEATKIIRHEHKSVMLIAISAIEDSERQKLILANGAEDYISKPINADIFNTRITNYITLIKARSNNVMKSTKSVNLFTQEIFSRHTKFMLTSEDALAEFWEFFLLNARLKYDGLSDVIRSIISIAEMQLDLKCADTATVEDSKDFQYFTMENIDKIPSAAVNLILKKNNVLCEYKIENNQLSFKLKKVFVEVEEEIVLVEKNIETIPVVEKEVVPKYTSQKLQVYNYLEEEDFIDLAEFINKLSSLMLLVGGGDVTEEEVSEIYTYIDKIGSILSTYSEVFTIAQALSNLSVDLSNHIPEFVENSEALGPMCSAFSRDLITWMEQSFNTGAPSADFMNDTIAVNCETIGSMLKMNEEVDANSDDFDDIFDF